MRILLFYDNLIRDYRGLLLLSEILKRRGHQTWVAPLWDRGLDTIRYYYPDTIVMGQVGEETTSAVGHFAKNNGINVVLNTTENVCYEHRKQYFFKTNFRQWNETLIDLQVIIGRDFDLYIREHNEIKDKSKYRFIGCPRFDLSVHPEICRNETRDLLKKYGLHRFNTRYLYISSFIFDEAGGQASKENETFIKIPQRFAREKEQKRQHHEILTHLIDDLRPHNGVLLIKRHPWDKSDYFRELYQGDNIILLDNHDYIVPLLQVSDVMLHTESTVAIEGWIQRKKTVSLLPDFDGDRSKLKNHMVHEPIARSYSELKDILSCYPWERTERSLENYQPYIDGNATIRLANEIETLPVKSARKKISLSERERIAYVERHIEERQTYATRLKSLPADQYHYHLLYLEQFRRRIDSFYTEPILKHVAEHCGPTMTISAAQGPEAVLIRATDDFVLGRYEMTIDRLASLVTGVDDGCGGRAHLLAARCRWRKGEEALALLHFEHAVVVAPDDADIRKHFAQFLMETGNLPTAVQHCQYILDRRPDDADVLMMLSDAARNVQKHALSQDLVRRVLAIEPSHPEALARIAALGAGDVAVVDANQHITADGDLGNLPALGKTQRFGRWAVPSFPRPGTTANTSRDHRPDPQPASVHIRLGHILMNESDWQSALDHFQCAGQDSTLAAQAHYGCALCCYRLGQFQQAAVHCQQALSWIPDFLGIAQQFRSYLMDRPYTVSFEARFAADLYILLAESYLQLGQADNARLAHQASGRLDISRKKSGRAVEKIHLAQDREVPPGTPAQPTPTRRTVSAQYPIAEKLTVLLITHFTEKMRQNMDLAPPGVGLIRETYHSLCRVFGPVTNSLRRIVCLDQGPGISAEHRLYQTNLEDFAGKYRCEMLRTPGAGLQRLLAAAVDRVATPYLMLVEHDWRFQPPSIDIHRLVRAFDDHGQIHQVRFNQRENTIARFDYLLEHETVLNGIPLLRTVAHSNNPSIFRTSTLRDVWLPLCLKDPVYAAMDLRATAFGVEEPLFKRHIQDVRIMGFTSAHEKWGTYVYGRAGDPARIVQLGI